MLIDPFQPGTLAQTTCSVTAASQYFAVPGNGYSLELYNSGTNIVFIETTTANGTAATVANSYPVGPGQCKGIMRHPGDTGITAIAAVAGPTVLYVTAGNGT